MTQRGGLDAACGAVAAPQRSEVQHPAGNVTLFWCQRGGTGHIYSPLTLRVTASVHTAGPHPGFITQHAFLLAFLGETIKDEGG